MGSVIIDQDFPYDLVHRGDKDARRHNKRVDDAAKKQIKDIISQQDIITSEGNKKVKVRLKYLDQYRFIHSRDRVDEVGRDEFDDLKEGEVLYKPGDGGGKESKAGQDEGEEVYEAEYTIDDLTDMLMKELNLPDLDERKKNIIVSKVPEWNDLSKSGIRSLIDKKRTLKSSFLRRAKQKIIKKRDVINDDLRYRTFNMVEERYSNAVVFLMMDRSGSMMEDKIYAVKVLYFWIVQFLKRKYDNVVIKFIAHDYTAREMNEKDFFTIADSGGTKVSSAYEMCRDMIKHNYPSSMWNIYCFHASDGDSWGDEREGMDLVKEITVDLGANLFAYTEIQMDEHGGDSTLMSYFEEEMDTNDKVLVSIVTKVSDIVDTIGRFLKYSVRTSY